MPSDGKDSGKQRQARQARRELARGSWELRRGRRERALEHLTEAVRLNPDDYAVRVNLGTALYKLERYTPALEHLRRATELEAARPQAWMNIAAAEMALGHLEAAEQALERAAETDPDRRDLHYNRATLYLRRGEALLAMAELELELANTPRHRLARDLLTALQSEM